MNMKKTIFSPADILLPDYEADSKSWTGYAVIACDQFTSEPEYWESAEKLAKQSPLSALNLILPEAYLGTPMEQAAKKRAADSMKNICSHLALHPDCLVYLERTLPDGKIRRGIVGKVDLEQYDFSSDSASAVRATEQTVVERIPPRVAVRKSASVELPHVMILCDDTEKQLILPLADKKNEMKKLYGFELMLGGGRADAWEISGETLAATIEKIAAYEQKKLGGVVYAMGDGNHSLASAKAHFENIKKELGEKAMQHPARYALCEMVDLGDGSLEFEPIYRLLKNCNPDEVLSLLSQKGKGSVQKVNCIAAGIEKIVGVPARHPLTVGSLQMFLDDYVKSHPGTVCDYIHGEDTVKALAENDGCLGFVFEGVRKDELFGYVEKNGTLPRKTFSMGEAKSKRYYIEARKITLR